MKKIITAVTAAVLLAGCLLNAPCDAQAKVKTYNLENKQARAYLSQVTYTDADYTISKIGQYTTNKSDRYDRPASVKIKFPKKYKKVTVRLATNKKMTSNKRTVKKTSKTGYVTVTNLIPQKTYYYKVKNSKGKVIAKGSFKTSGNLRMCSVAGVHNVRDIGGWTTVSGKKIRYGKIYRGGEMDRGRFITAAGKTTMLKTLGIKAEIDLRNDTEMMAGTEDEITSSALGDSVYYRRYDILQFDFSEENTQKLEKVFRVIFKKAEAGKPIYVHCAVGCDRTETIIFLTEGLLGVSESDLAKDYELSSFYHERTRNSADYKALIEAVNQFEGGTLQEKITNYFYQMGFTKEEIAAFKKAMLK